MFLIFLLKFDFFFLIFIIISVLVLVFQGKLNKNEILL